MAPIALGPNSPLSNQAIMGTYNLGGRLPHLNSNLDPKIDELITKDEILGDLMESIPFRVRCLSSDGDRA